jgi:hypothetical protein
LTTPNIDKAKLTDALLAETARPSDPDATLYTEGWRRAATYLTGYVVHAEDLTRDDLMAEVNAEAALHRPDPLNGFVNSLARGSYSMCRWLAGAIKSGDFDVKEAS